MNPIRIGTTKIDGAKKCGISPKILESTLLKLFVERKLWLIYNPIKIRMYCKIALNE
jgi:hypothetical protein